MEVDQNTHNENFVQNFLRIVDSVDTFEEIMYFWKIEIEPRFNKRKSNTKEKSKDEVSI